MATNNSFWNVFTLIWDFFASVKLALATLCTISLASIIGTIVPQKESLTWYSKKFSPQIAQFLELFNLTDMFGSFWFKALLGLLSANLIICSLDRFPGVWKQIKVDNLTTPVKRLIGMKRNASWTVSEPPSTKVKQISQFLHRKGWKISSRETENGMLLFSQKAAWSRLGVFVVHTSILVILIGAILGSILGFKGSISILEGKSTGRIQTFGIAASTELGFEIRCDAFNIDFYQNGMPKEYRSDLTILEQGREILHKSIKVNAPLTYKGITFYQSSYEGYKDFIVTLTDTESGNKQTFMAPFQKQLEWPEKQLRFGVINAEADGERISRIKIWFADESGDPSVFWMDAGNQVTVERQGKKYLFSAKQMYATGLQVSMDPGVWWVYSGCGLLLLGLFTAFFMSHRKLWLLVGEKNGKTALYMAGSANKNKTGFDRIFSELAEDLKNIKQ
jgi:cytochrome c biogenesis protein